MTNGTPLSSTGPKTALVAVLLVHAALWLRWMAGTEVPAGTRDEFMLVENVTEIVFGWGVTPWDQMRPFTVDAYYPPLSSLPGVCAVALGGGYRAVVASQLPWAALLVASVVHLARSFGGRWTPPAAVALLLAYPAIADALHHFEPNLGATACTAAALAAWAASDDLRKRRATLAMGTFIALGLLTDRLGTAPFLVAPIVLSVIRRRGERRAAAREAMVAASVAVGLAGWWYAVFFFPNFLHELLPQFASGEVGARGDLDEVRPPLLLWLTHYLVLWPDTHLGLFAGLLGWSALGAALLGRLGDRGRDLAIFVVAGVVLFSLPAKRQSFYTVPLLPAVAVISAALGEQLLGRLPRLGRVALAVTAIALMTWPTITNSRPHREIPHGAVSGWIVGGRSPLPERWIGERFPIGSEPLGLGLDVPAIGDALRDAGVGPHRPIAVWSDSAAVSESQLLSLLRMERRSLAVDGVTVDPEWFETVLPTLAALVSVSPSRQPCGPPSPESVQREFEIRFGWEERPAIMNALEQIPATGRLVVQQDLALDARVCVWVTGSG